ncbi:MAG: zinc ribbon domain-containing protein [Eubacteriales bacterium]|nr:zinc ribbon domain-containing protein [Eubacteriales bacterium]
MDNFVEKIKAKFSKAVDGAEKYANIAVDKTSSLIDKAKISVAVNDAEKKIKDIMAEIGEYVYDNYGAGVEFPDEIGTKCAEIEALKQEIAELKKSVVCSHCGEYNPSENEYCGKCGEMLN